MSDLIFSISQTFSLHPRNGALGKNEAKRFYIAPYQRGYKWSSATQYSPVQLLMTDLKDAFESKSKEYYLQFITLIPASHNGERVLEVIDGQQRLTTITVLFSVMNYKLKGEDRPFTDDKLSYEVRANVSNFLKDFVYKGLEELLNLKWEDFTSQHPHYDEQDIYYLFHAAHKINEMLPDGELQEFHDYVSNHVMLILNLVENNISCERIFSNLNTNKVELTSVELIKGLLLTKSARDNIATHKIVPYKEILEQRVSMGRQWDEIDNWANRPEINSFYFDNSKDPIHELLILLASKDDYKSAKEKENRYDLFNFFQSSIKKGMRSPSGYFAELKKLKFILDDWYVDNSIYNSLGFLFMAKGAKFNIAHFLDKIECEKKTLIQLLNTHIQNLFTSEINDLSYGDYNNEIHNLLLSLSVFGNSERFDFYAFKNNEWSLEHIFPQTPKQFPPELKQMDISLINSIIEVKLKEKIDNSNENSHDLQYYKSLASKLQQATCKLSEYELYILCNLLGTKLINSIGNMALLAKSDNSSNGNGMFDSKRINIVKRVSNGSFVPKHTYDVFSKLLSDKMNPNLSAWYEQDIKAHQEWIISATNKLKSKGN
jgi:uncharacterized protein with ParB-like and HNH nuclease domain